MSWYAPFFGKNITAFKETMLKTKRTTFTVSQEVAGVLLTKSLAYIYCFHINFYQALTA